MKKNLLILFICFSGYMASGQSLTWNTLKTTGEVLERHENALAKVGDQIILIGGRGNKPLNILDLKTGQWREGTQPPLEIHHFQAVTLDGLVYVLGGLTGGYPYETPFSHILIYDVLEDLWIIGPEIPENRRRGAAGVAVHNNKIYLVNGIINGHTSGWVNWLDEFDPYTGAWKILPDSPVARDHFQAVTIGDKLYVAGGRRSGSAENGFAGTVKSTNVYDFQSQTWKTLPDIPTPRAGTSSINFKGNLVVLGGESDRQEIAHNEVEMFDLSSSTWRTLEQMKEGRHGTQAIVLNDQIITGAGSGNRGGGPELKSFEILSSEENVNLASDSLVKGELVPSVQQLNLSDANSVQSFTIENNSGNQAVLISYLETDHPELFTINNSAVPFVIAPGTKRKIEVELQNGFSEAEASSGTLFIKPAGESAPVQVLLNSE